MAHSCVSSSSLRFNSTSLTLSSTNPISSSSSSKNVSLPFQPLRSRKLKNSAIRSSSVKAMYTPDFYGPEKSSRPAVLDRVLVIPSPKVDYEFKKILDIEHINKCLGNKLHHVDIILLCYFSSPQPCFLDDDHVNKLNKELGLTLSKVEAVWEEDVKEPKPKKVEDILAKFSSDDDVIAVGLLVYTPICTLSHFFYGIFVVGIINYWYRYYSLLIVVLLLIYY